jgi:hypothetical protein
MGDDLQTSLLYLNYGLARLVVAQAADMSGMEQAALHRMAESIAQLRPSVASTQLHSGYLHYLCK